MVAAGTAADCEVAAAWAAARVAEELGVASSEVREAAAVPVGVEM